MAHNTVLNTIDPSVSLSLQSLIDERSNTPFTTHTDMQGLNSMSGPMRSRRRGRGLEFEDLRNYAPGDDIRHIDWKVSARHNQLYTRIFREEKEQLITLAVDFTSAMFTGSTELKAIQAARMAANIAWHLVSAGGRCGLLIQTDNAFHAVRPALGDRAALSVCAALAKQFEQAKQQLKSGAKTNSQPVHNNISLLERLRMSDASTGAVILLAGLDHTEPPFLQKIKELQLARALVVLSIEDPLEYTPLPTGSFYYKSNNNNTSIVLNKKQAAELKRTLDQQNRQLIEAFAQAHVPLLQSRIGIVKLKATLTALGFLA